MINKLTSGQQISATVVAISNDCIFIDINSKSEGILDKTEFTNEEGICSIKEGDTIKAFFLGEINGEMRFTTKIAGQNADSSMIENAYKNGITVEGKVEQEIKGGFQILIGQTKAFCPFSQMGYKQKETPNFYIGKTLSFKIQEYKENGKNILVSNKAILEEEHFNKLSESKNQIKQGMIFEATVKSLHNFGAFVDINGIQALLPISEISFKRVQDINSELTEGQKIKVQVLNIDWQHERISVSAKALLNNPWTLIKDKYKVGDKIDGTISKVSDFGIFINIEEGIDGLVHISSIENIDKNTNLKKVFKVGQAYSVQIKEINIQEKRISLIPSSTAEQDETAKKYLNNQDDSDTYNPFAAFFKK